MNTTYSKIFNNKNTDHLNSMIFLDPKGQPQIARYEQVKYPQIENFTEKQLSFFWKPEEVDLTKDKSDFGDLTEAHQHIFTSNLKRQTMLDSINGRGPNLAFLPVASLPEVETWIETWGQNETLHSRAYTHIIRNIYANPSTVFDEINDIEEILECAADIAVYYDELIKQNALYELANHNLTTTELSYSPLEHKKAIWLAMNAVNALEGVRFYVSFACSWNFAELKLMEGNAKIIKLICRDENLHLGFTQYMLRTLPKDDPDYIKIAEETKDEVIEMFNKVMNQEKDWARYLFKFGSIIGLNEDILCDYVDWIASKRMRTIGLDVTFDHPTSDPLPWTKTWISNKKVQVAPQEAEISSYLISDVKQDIDDKMLDGLSL